MPPSTVPAAGRALPGGLSDALGREWSVAVRESVRAFALSRAVVWITGLVVIAAFGWADSRGARLDPLWACRPTGTPGIDALVAPGCRWDSTWYLDVARGGYRSAVPARSAFFPLYPLLVSIVSTPLGGALVPAGLLVSWSAALGFLTLLHRVVARARDAATATTVVRVAAYVPPAIFLSAVYTEALFLLLSLGALVAARRDRWALAGVLGLVAASCRSIGVLLVVPLAVEYLWGRRGGPQTRASEGWSPWARLAGGRRPAPAGRSFGRRGAVAATAMEGRGWSPAAGVGTLPGARAWLPRRGLRPDVLWIALVPLGVALYAAYLGVATGDPMGAVAAQGDWERRFLTPVGGLLEGAWAVLGRLGDYAGLWHVAPLIPDQMPSVTLARDVVLLAFVVAAITVLWWARRRLPASWVAWGVVSLAYPLSVPSVQQPLMSLPRFTMACFPLVVALGLWAHRGRRMRWMAPLLLTLQAGWAVIFVAWIWAP
ncbi:mannosyltransferase family protein [Patulibacter sp. NPDC049589]|uniref:mannosyltransferase family protein n=1 Tax=Patulibacter sp. NPDC049589 TaxID=3154731 RepID=UPI00344A3B3C